MHNDCVYAIMLRIFSLYSHSQIYNYLFKQIKDATKNEIIYRQY